VAVDGEFKERFGFFQRKQRQYINLINMVARMWIATYPRDNDNTFNAAFGLESPHQNALRPRQYTCPLNDGGLRSEITPTIGMIEPIVLHCSHSFVYKLTCAE
jgi:hypothetical protein